MTAKRKTKVWGDTEIRVCPLCGDEFKGLGNNPDPLGAIDDRCCDDCNYTKVIPARIGAYIDPPT